MKSHMKSPVSGAKRGRGRPPNSSGKSNQKSKITSMFPTANHENESSTQPGTNEVTGSETPSNNEARGAEPPDTPEVMETQSQQDETSGTPTRTNSQKKRSRGRGTRGSKNSVQKTLFDGDRVFQSNRVYETRFDFSFKLPASSKPPETVQTIIQEVIKAFHENSDESIQILPWKLEDQAVNPILSKHEHVPKQLSSLRNYFPRLRISKKETIVYTNILLAHDNEVEDIMLDMSFWLEDEGIKLFRKTIQAEEVSVLGWFLYGIKEINTKTLADAIYSTDNQTEVGLRQMRIRTQVGGKASSIRAMGIECDATKEDLVKRQLIRLYNSKSTSWPLGVKLRYMRDPRFLCGSMAVVKSKHLLGRHERFQNGIGSMRTNDIASLDMKDGTSGKSLRMILMSIHSNKIPSVGLFHSIDPIYNQPENHLVTFLPEFKSQVETVITQMIPFLKFKEGSYVEKWFTTEAILRSEGCIWDKDMGCAISALDDELDDITNLDDCYDISNPSKPSTVLEVNTDPNTHTEPLFAYENDSVSTLGTNANSNVQSVANLVPQVGTRSATSSVATDISMRTRSSIVTAVKQDLDAELRASIRSLLREEFGNLGARDVVSTNPPTNKDVELTHNVINNEEDAPHGMENAEAGPSDGTGGA